MTIYAIKDPKNQNRSNLIFNSLKTGIARFGWSYYDVHDLNQVTKMTWEEIDGKDSKGQTDIRFIWNKASWLLNVAIGDFFVYINVPNYGECSIVKITSAYYFEKNGLDGDFSHAFKCDFINTINRNNAIASKLSYSSLRPRQRYHRIYDEDHFYELLENLKNNNLDLLATSDDLISQQIENFNNDVTPILLEKMVHYFSQKRFEDFIMAILKDRETTGEILNPYVFRGWGVDQGCDIHFEYYNAIFNKKESVIVQLKAYQGIAYVSEAIKNLTNFLEKGNTATQAIIMTTASQIDEKDCELAKKEFEKKYNIPLSILYGRSLLSWIFKYGNNILFSGDNID